MKKIRLPLTLALCVLAHAALAASPFREPLPVDVGQVYASPSTALATADFNGDGFEDVAVAHRLGRLVVALNDGAPFAASQATAIPEYTRALAAGDFNSDGKADLIYALGGEAVVLLGQGNGTFVEGPKVTTQHNDGPIAMADVNGDTRPDLILAGTDMWNTSGGRVSVHFNTNGTGFTAAFTTTTTRSVLALAARDLNADGRADVVVSTGGSGHTQSFLGTAVNTLTGVWSDFRVGSIAVAELTGDAHPDLVVQSFTGNVSVYTGNGNGTFTWLRDLETPASDAVVIADLDADGFQDVVSLGMIATVHRGAGNGTFANALFFKGLFDKGRYSIRDFDRDGKLDLLGLAQGDFTMPRLHFLAGEGSGAFKTDRAYLVLLPHDYYSRSASHATAGDFDGNQKPDVAVVMRSNGNSNLAVLRNDGSGGLQLPLSMPAFTTDAVQHVAAARLDGDTRSDLVVITRANTGAQTATPFLAAADGALTRGTSFAVAAVEYGTLHLVDVTGDGAVDLLYGNSIYDGNGDGTFDAARTTAATFSLLADVDENGAPDALWFNGSTLQLARNAGGGVFEAAVTVANVRGASAAADFNGDGHLDLLSRGDSSLIVHAGHGDGTFDKGFVMQVPSYVGNGAPRIADFDGDGHLDVAMSYLFLGDGHGRFRDMHWIYPPDAVADFDGNGSADLLRLNAGIALVQRSGLVAAGTKPTSTTLTSSVPESEHGAQVSLPAKVSGGVVPVDGTVLYSIDGVPFAFGGLSIYTDDAPAGFTSAAYNFPVGQYTVTATYTGSATYASSSASVQQSVDRATTTLSVQAPDTAYGNGPMIWVQLSPSYGPTGTVTVKNGDQVLGSATASQSMAITLAQLDAGTYTLTVEYSGDANYKSSTRSVPFTVTKRKPTLSVTSSAPAPGAVPLTASFPYESTLAKSGTIRFVLDGRDLGTYPLQSDNKASVTTELAAGTYDLYAHYSGDANHEAVSAYSRLTVYGGSFGTPVVLSAKGRATSAELRWTPIVGAIIYYVYVRKTPSSPAELIAEPVDARWTVQMPANTTWLYQVEARTWGNQRSGSNWDFATTVPFTDDPLVPGTIMRARHVAELRAAANALRTFAGLPAFAFGEAVPAGSLIRAADVQSLRTAIGEARAAIAMPVAFTGTIGPGTPVQGVHWSELRGAVD